MPEIGNERKRPERSQRVARALVNAIPHDELPDALDRADLQAAIMTGAIEHVYSPMGATYHNVCVAGLPSWVDQRLKVTRWAEMRRAGLDMTAIRAAMVAEAKARMGLALDASSASSDEEARS